MDPTELTTLQTIVEFINAGGIVAVLVIIVAGFWTGKLMSRATHDEIEKKQEVIVDTLVERINGHFVNQEKKFETFTGSIGVLTDDYFKWQDEWRQTLKNQTESLTKQNGILMQMSSTLQSIDTEIKRQNGS